MKKQKIFILAVTLFFVFSAFDCFSFLNNKKDNSTSDEIIFYSNGSSFSPVIILQSDAEVIWTWDDNTTSNSTTPVKNYGTAQLRKNSLKVTPWSAVRRINIGYDAGDGGTNSIEFVNDQKVSQVENLNLVAPNLKEWCSSYNNLTSLDFSNFINLETIECFLSYSLKTVNLSNTPKLKRACFENNDLKTFDLSGSPALEDIRGALNAYETIEFSNQTDNIWHICVRDNLQITDQQLFNDISKFPSIAELYIWSTNQTENLIIPKSHSTRRIEIFAFNNQYKSLNLEGSLINKNAYGWVDLRNNKLENVNIEGCIQIKKLDLSYNKLESSTIDEILKQVDEYGTSSGTIDLRFNNPPTYIGLQYIANLKNRGWTVNTDPNIPVETISVSSSSGNVINTDNGTLQLQASVLPTDATTKTVTWSVIDLTGKASISTSGLITAIKDGTVKAIATAMDGSGEKGEILITISNQVVPVENILVTSSETTVITTDNGTIQLQVSVLPTDASNQSVTWSVIDVTGKASISASGLLTAERNGTVKAIATATDGSGVTGEILIAISNQVIPVEIIEINSPEGNSINTDNGTLQLQVSIFPTDATTKTVIWSVIDLTGKASISTSGLITAIKDGTVKAIATAMDGSEEKGEILISISNQIIPIESILISSIGETSINKDNGTLQLQASVLPIDATTKTVTWSVIDLTGKATISTSGLITAQKDGIVKAIAVANNGSGVKGEILISISNQIIPVESISVHSFSGTNITTDKGTLQLNVSILPTDATTKTFTWSVVEVTGKASINDSGLLTAISNGTVKAIATATDGSGVKSELLITISNQIVLIKNITIVDELINDTIKGIGTKLKLKVQIAPQNATDSNVNWFVENITGRAKIDQDGELTTISSGKIKVIAKALDESQVTAQKAYTIAIPVLLQEHNYPENIRIFPNPSSGKIRVQIEKLPANGVELEVRNPLGQVIIKKQINENRSEWSLEDYPFYLYFVTIIDKEKATTYKIINGLNRK